MTPRSNSRLVSSKKAPTKKRRTATKKKELEFHCYRVTDMMTLHFLATRTEALTVQKELKDNDQDAHLQRITIKSHEDLAKVLREHTV